MKIKKNHAPAPSTPERILLGTLLSGAANPQSNQAIDALLSPAPEGFLDQRHGEIAAAIRHLRQNSSTAITTAAVCRRLGDTRRLQSAGGPGYVCGLLKYAVASALLPDCVTRLLSEKAEAAPPPQHVPNPAPAPAPAPTDANPSTDDELWPEFPDNSPSDNSLHTRVGKIARLPVTLRDQLNSRLLDGQPVDELLAWLNALPEANDVLARLFDSRPINKQNISEWRRGGFQDWLVQQQAAHVFLRLSEDAAAIGPVAVVNFAEQLAVALASRLAIMIDRFDPRTGDLEDQARVAHQLFRDLATLRNAAYKRERLALQKESLVLRRAESDRRAERERLKELRLQRAEQERAARRSKETASTARGNGRVPSQASVACAPPVETALPGSLPSRDADPTCRGVALAKPESSQVKPDVDTDIARQPQPWKTSQPMHPLQPAVA